MSEKIKFALALLLLVLGVVGFYLLSEQALILRILAVMAGLGLSFFVALQTPLGQQLLDFSKSAVVEAKKVVWPTRKETLQTTGLVFAFVLLMAIFLWATDKTLEWVMYDLLLNWRKV